MSGPARLAGLGAAARRAPLGLALLVAALLAGPGRAEEPRPLALTNAHLHPVSGAAVESATLVVVGRRIAAAGVGVAVPPGAQVLDLAGARVYPGLIDADTVLGLVEVDSVPGTLDTRESGRIQPNLRPELALNPDSALLGVARTGGVLLAHVAARSGLVAGGSALVYTAGWSAEDMVVRAPVTLHVRWPAMRVAPGERRRERVLEREEALQALRAAFREARAYFRAQRSAGERPLAADAKWEAMRRVVAAALGDEEGALGGALPVAVVADTLPQIEAALDWARQERVRLVLVGGADAWRIAQRLRAEDVPVILGPVLRQPLRDWEGLHTHYQAAGVLHAAGVRIAFSTGGNAFAAANARNLVDHAALSVGHGLPPAAALRALTLGAAQVLGVAERLGSLEVGKEATLIVVDRDLFDFRARVTHALVAGQAVSLVDRHRALYERYRARPPR